MPGLASAIIARYTMLMCPNPDLPDWMNRAILPQNSHLWKYFIHTKTTSKIYKNSSVLLSRLEHFIHHTCGDFCNDSIKIYITFLHDSHGSV